MNAEQAARAAAALDAARASGAPLGPLPEGCRPASLADGYAVQAARHALLDARGADAVAGFKIGCTTPVMQAFLDIPHPCAGRMRGLDVRGDGAAWPLAGAVRPAVEAEIAVTLAAPLRPGDAPFDRERVAAAVGACHASIEVVDDRYADFRSLGVPTLVADDFFHVGCALGPALADWRGLDLAAVACTLSVDGAVEGTGAGRDIMGHPLAALAWLADHAASRGESLEAGSVVTLGSMVQTRWITGPCTVEVRLEGIGAVGARFT